MAKSYKITRNHDECLLSGKYIGEDYIIPKLINFHIHYMLTGHKFPLLHLCYYGEPTDELKERFGYDKSTA